MRLSNKQKSILYVGTVLIILFSLYANSFIKERNFNMTETINNKEIRIY